MSPVDIDYTPTITLSNQAWLSGLETLIGGLAGPPISTTAHSLSAAKVHFTYQYKTRIKIQALSQDPLHRPFSIALAAAATGNATDPGAGNCRDMAKGAKCNFQNTFTGIARDFITFGINIVPNGPKETHYDQTPPKASPHNEIYAVVDFTVMPKRFPITQYPYFQAGLPLSGKALHYPYIGAAYSIPIRWVRANFPVSVFAGTMIMQQKSPTGAQDRAIKLLWGFSVPITSFSGAEVTGPKK